MNNGNGNSNKNKHAGNVIRALKEGDHGESVEMNGQMVLKWLLEKQRILTWVSVVLEMLTDAQTH